MRNSKEAGWWIQQASQHLSQQHSGQPKGLFRLGGAVNEALPYPVWLSVSEKAKQNRKLWWNLHPRPCWVFQQLHHTLASSSCSVRTLKRLKLLIRPRTFTQIANQAAMFFRKITVDTDTVRPICNGFFFFFSYTRHYWISWCPTFIVFFTKNIRRKMKVFTYKVQLSWYNTLVGKKITYQCNTKEKNKTLQKCDLVEVSHENECYNLCVLTFLSYWGKSAYKINLPLKNKAGSVSTNKTDEQCG